MRGERRVATEDSPAFYQSEVEERPGTAIALLVDTSGSMSLPAPRDGRPKYVVAREAIEHVLLATEQFAARRPDYPIKIAIFGFASAPWEVLPIQPWNREAVSQALGRLPGPGGGTAIGAALRAGRAALYRSGAIRKYVLVVTDGENTAGAAPDGVAREIFAKSRGAVSISFVAFDTSPAAFAFLREVGGDVLAAGDGTRPRPLIQRLRGKPLPKQYVSFVGTRSLLEHTFSRVESILPPERVFTVVARDHLRYPEARKQLITRPKGRVVVQPANRDTLPGLLLPLLQLRRLAVRMSEMGQEETTSCVWVQPAAAADPASFPTGPARQISLLPRVHTTIDHQ